MNVIPVTAKTYNSVNQTNQLKTQKTPNFKGTIVGTGGVLQLDELMQTMFKFIPHFADVIDKAMPKAPVRDFKGGRVLAQVNPAYDNRGEEMAAKLNELWRQDSKHHKTYAPFKFSKTPINPTV